ncbi:MAG TPA: NAD(P)H-dependent oxidoreductase [Xylella sp.]
MKVLHIDSSILGNQSVSKEIARHFLEKLNLASRNNSHEIIYRDIAKKNINHLTG